MSSRRKKLLDDVQVLQQQAQDPEYFIKGKFELIIKLEPLINQPDLFPSCGEIVDSFLLPIVWPLCINLFCVWNRTTLSFELFMLLSSVFVPTYVRCTPRRRNS